jgi:CDP-glucose 4,6-dehydratase
MTSLRAHYEGRRVLVTGHTGFKGGWLALWLKALGADVCGISLAPVDGPTFCRMCGVEDAVDRHEIADVRDYEATARVFAEYRPEYVFHLAAQSLVLPSYDRPKETFDTNVGGTVNVLECVRNTASVRAFVNVTSDKCYENREWVWAYREEDRIGGADPYSASKGAAEVVFSAYARSFFSSMPSLGAASARAGNVVGGGDWAPFRIVPDCVRSLAAGVPVIVRNPRSVRPWQHVLEPLGGYLQLAARLHDDPENFAGAWNFGPDDENAVGVGRLVDAVIAAWGSGAWRHHESQAAPHEARALTLSCEKARRMLGWRPRWGFDETVRKTVEWYRAAGDDATANRDLALAQIVEYEGGTMADEELR